MMKFKEWFPGNFHFKNIYKASVDGFSSAAFHQKCDDWGPTLVVIESIQGFVFGGFTCAKWSSNGYTMRDTTAFLFTLTNPHGMPATRYPILEKEVDNAIVCHPNFGPIFGGRPYHGIIIYSDSHQNAHSNTNFPSSFGDVTGKGNTTFTGHQYFQAKEIEVYFVYSM